MKTNIHFINSSSSSKLHLVSQAQPHNRERFPPSTIIHIQTVDTYVVVLKLKLVVFETKVQVLYLSWTFTLVQPC